MTPRNALTGKAESARSINGQLLTSPDGLALTEKRAFRLYREFSANFVLKVVFTTPFYLTAQKLWTGQGACRVVISTGGTEGGTFVALPSKFPLNTADGATSTATTATQNGTITGGTEREVIRVDSGTAGGGAGNVDALGGRRKLAAGTYYFSGVITGTTQGLYAFEWEEIL